MKQLSLLALFFAGPLYAASFPCIVSLDTAGNVSMTCGLSTTVPPVPPAPTPTPTPTPSPTPTPTPPVSGSGCVMNPPMMKVGGTNNFPAVTGTGVCVIPLPTQWPGGAPVTLANIMFAQEPEWNPVGALYETAFSPTPGDFTYYKDATVGGYTPCGKIDGPNSMLTWSTTFGAIDSCKIDGRQWYLNYRVIGCPAGQICGQTFYVPRG